MDILRGLSPRLSVSQSACLSVRKVYCGKTADWIQMPFRVVSGVGRGMGVLHGGVIVDGIFCVEEGGDVPIP